MSESEERRRRDESLPMAHHVLELGRDDLRRLVLIEILRSVVLSAALIAVFYLLPFTWAPALQVGAAVVAGAALIAGVGRWQLRAVAHAAFPALRAIEALAISTTVLLVLFASVYLTLSHSDSGAFSEPLNHTGALYFTVTTLTTVGFGDIAATTDVARVTVMFQMLANFVVLGVLVKLIISVARERLANSPPPDGN
jgi:hypothetical protein